MGSKSGKFLESVKSGYRLPRVMLAAIDDRVEPLPQALRRAAKRGMKNSKHVHQLRVTARRGEATLKLFSDYLPEKAAKKLAKRMRQVRRTAGEIRNLDVLIARLESEDSNKLSKLLSDLKSHRVALQPNLFDAVKELEHSSWDRQLQRLQKSVRRMRAKTTPRFGTFAYEKIEEQAEEFFRLSLRDLSRIDALHELRICGKKLRYSIELTVGAFPTDMRTKVYPKFVNVQERLGEVNDYATAIDLFSHWNDTKFRRSTAALIAEDTIKMHRAAQQFREWFHTNRRKRLGKLFAQILELNDHEFVRRARSK